MAEKGADGEKGGESGKEIGSSSRSSSRSQLPQSSSKDGLSSSPVLQAPGRNKYRCAQLCLFSPLCSNPVFPARTHCTHTHTHTVWPIAQSQPLNR